MRRLHADGEPVDVLTVRDQLERDGTLQEAGGRAAIDELTGGVPGLGGIRRYAQMVIDCARARELLNVSYDIQARIHERRHDGAQLLADAEQMIFKLGQTARRTRDTPLSDALDEELARLSELSGSDKTFTGLATGLPALDDMLNGLHPGRLYVLAARPGMGKTSIAQNIAVHAALKENASVLFASLEMGEAELAQRHLSAESGIDANRIQRATLNTGDWPRLLESRRTPPTPGSSSWMTRIPRYWTRARRAAGRGSREGARLGHRRRPAAHARRPSAQQPHGGRQRVQPRPQTPRTRARVPGHRAVAALTPGRAAHRQAPAAVGPA